MSTDDNSQKKVKELVELMSKFADENPLTLPPKKESILDTELDTDFAIVEASRTITYSQKGWNQYGKLVGYTQGN